MYEVFDKDEIFVDIEHDTVYYFGVVNLKITMSKLSRLDICDVIKTFGSTAEYSGMNSRWQFIFV